MTQPPINLRLAELAFKKVTGNLTDEESIELEHILEISPDKRALFEELMNPDRNAEDLVSMSGSNVEASWDKVKASVPFTPKKRGSGYFIAAASVILVIGSIVVYLLWNEKNKPAIVQNANKSSTIHPVIIDSVAKIVGGDGTEIVVGRNQLGIVAYIDDKPVLMKDHTLIIPDIETRGPVIKALPGKELQVQLTDGTRVWLSGSSVLDFQEGFTTVKRTLALKGEAYFEVAKGADAHFAVNARGMKATALGTMFTISAYDKGAVITSLFEGKLNLSGGEKDMLLSKNEEAVWNNNKFLRRSLPKTSTDKMNGKINGYFLFDDKIKTILDEVAKNYSCEIVYKGDFSDKEYYGKFPRNMPIDSLLRKLSTSMVVDLALQGNKIIADFTKFK